MAKKILKTVLTVIFLAAVLSAAAGAVTVKVKDITSISGMIENQAVGYGIVVGLNGTGDKGKDFATVQSVVNMLSKLGVKVPTDKIESSNCAAVIVTSTLPSSFEAGEKMDVHISSMGNAKSLYGGILVMTPLSAGNSEIYAMAQGPVSVGGHNYEVNNNVVSKNSPTSGYITGGAIIGKTYKADYLTGTSVTLFLEKTDFSLSDRIIKSLNTKYGKDTAQTADGKALIITVPVKFTGHQAELMAEIGDMEVEGNPVSGIVLDERTGTIIMGAGIKIDEVAISHGNIHVAVASHNIVSQPNSFGSGNTIQTIDSSMTVNEDMAKFTTVKNNATLQDLVKSLTSLGATADDIIAIITDMKVAGAIKGTILLR